MIIIADDLTGANDTGIQLVKQGKEAVVHLVPSENIELVRDKINVINADSRALSSEDAYARNAMIARQIKAIPTSILYKKIDSTLRGHIGQEIDALIDELDVSWCAFVPAYPQNGRKTVGSYHLVHGELLEDSILSKDVTFPMKVSYIPDLLKKQTKRKIGTVELRTIRAGAIADAVRSLREDGCEIIVFDSAKERDLKAITSFLEGEDDVLYVGSAGLAQALSQSEGRTEIPRLSQPSDSPVLTIAGSVSDVTRGQIAYQKERGAHVIEFDPVLLLQEDDETLLNAREEAVAMLRKNIDTVVTTNISEEAMEQVERFRRKKESDYFDISNRIASALGRFARDVIDNVDVRGLILTGGDIAYHTCLQLNIHSLYLRAEIEEGIPLSTATDGPYRHLLIVTKAGAFGKPNSLHDAAETIRAIKI